MRRDKTRTAFHRFGSLAISCKEIHGFASRPRGRYAIIDEEKTSNSEATENLCHVPRLVKELSDEIKNHVRSNRTINVVDRSAIQRSGSVSVHRGLSRFSRRSHPHYQNRVFRRENGTVPLGAGEGDRSKFSVNVGDAKRPHSPKIGPVSKATPYLNR